jgi:S1-C subfamily serine protease
VLTNAHVISTADTITVRFFDGTLADADLVGSFPDDDIALVQVQDVVGTTPAELGTSATLQVGDDVLAIGNALDLGGSPSVTLGIVSALDREIDAGLLQLRDLIQTDAAINPGNSGGPLVNASGQVVGINTAIINDAQNVGFAIEIDAIRPLIDALVAGGGDITPDTAFLGVTTQTIADIPLTERASLGIDRDAGAYVADVVEGSGADDAGVLPGDVIVSVDGTSIESSEDVARAVRDRQPGNEMELTYRRAGATLRTTVTLGARGG